jgi:hypothetical protein
MMFTEAPGECVSTSVRLEVKVGSFFPLLFTPVMTVMLMFADACDAPFSSEVENGIPSGLWR